MPTCRVGDLTRVTCDKIVPTKTKLPIYQTVVRPTLLYGFETWPMSVKDEKAYGNNRDGDGAMGNGCEPTGSLEHRRNEEILEEAKVEPMMMLMIRRSVLPK